MHAYQSYATADVGLIAYETAAREGLVLDEGVIVEIVRPGTGDPVPDGEVGEVVVTALNPDYPLIRFGTGDLSAVLPGRCPTGRTNARIRGWLGRADQTTKVRGMFVHPSQVAEVLKRHPETRPRAAGRRRRDGQRPHDPARRGSSRTRRPGRGRGADGARRDQAARRGRLVAPGSLPNDGKVIEDARHTTESRRRLRRCAGPPEAYCAFWARMPAGLSPPNRAPC